MNEEQLKAIAEIARQAFWKSVAEQLPEITTGDLGPMPSFYFEEACECVIEIWYETNKVK